MTRTFVVTPEYSVRSGLDEIQETTILTALGPLIHLGMVFVGTPYGQNPQLLVTNGIGGRPTDPAP